MDTLPPGTVYGVPRGGSVIAGIAAARNPAIKATDDVKAATYVVDDVIDSGKTKCRYEMMGKVFYSMHAKDANADPVWIVYPWEHVDPLRDNEDTVRRQLELIGENPNREGLLDTPKRYLKAMKEMTQGYTLRAEDILATTFDADGYDEIVVLKNIDFTSLCEHHLLPFTGKASVAYLPGQRVVGLSKLARLVEMHAQRLQIQERMTAAIKNDLVNILRPRGTAVQVSAHHSCMGCRGVHKPGAVMVTSALSGVFKEQAMARSEVMELLK